jgi:hypothetical protein
MHCNGPLPQVNSQDDISPFVSVSNSQMDTPDKIQSPATVSSQNLNTLPGQSTAAPRLPYALRIQSNRLFDDKSALTSEKIKHLVHRDLSNRVTEVKPNLLAETLFPDDAFGFAVNEKFIGNFYN